VVHPIIHRQVSSGTYGSLEEHQGFVELLLEDEAIVDVLVEVLAKRLLTHLRPKLSIASMRTPSAGLICSGGWS